MELLLIRYEGLALDSVLPFLPASVMKSTEARMTLPEELLRWDEKVCLIGLPLTIRTVSVIYILFKFFYIFYY